MTKTKEQELIDICFQIGIAVHHHRSLQCMSKEKLAKWIADQLEGCGFPTSPVGTSWGVLKEKENEYRRTK